MTVIHRKTQGLKWDSLSWKYMYKNLGPQNNNIELPVNRHTVLTTQQKIRKVN